MDIQQFLDNHQLNADAIDTNAILDKFISEMKNGLADQDSSLAMIPSYITGEGQVPAHKPVIVLDAGGTNLRVCTVSFDEKGQEKIEHFTKHPMPGIDKEISKETFYNTICDYLEPVIDKSDSIGFCFSYATQISPQKDGKLLSWSKEVKVPQAVGNYIGAELLAALEKRGYQNKNIILLNDTVACLLAGKALGEQRQCGGYIGFILGTGTNTAYVEANQNVSCVEANQGSQIINVESGNFDGFAQNDMDKHYDESTDNPGQHIFEKMISGRYLGDITLAALHQAVKERIFNVKTLEFILQIKKLETAQLSVFLENPYAQDAVFNAQSIDAGDLEKIYYLVLAIVTRAAKLTAINIATAIIKSGKGHNPLHPVCINVDGSTYHKLYGFRAKSEAYLADILQARHLYCEIIEVDNAPIIGSAIAGLVG